MFIKKIRNCFWSIIASPMTFKKLSVSLIQWFSKCDHQTSNTCVTCELVSNTNYEVLYLRTESQLWGYSHLYLSKSPKWFWGMGSLRPTVLMYGLKLYIVFSLRFFLNFKNFKAKRIKSLFPAHLELIQSAVFPSLHCWIILSPYWARKPKLDVRTHK